MSEPLEGVFVPQPPNPNVAPAAYFPQYFNQANNQLRLYLSLLASNQLEIVKFINKLTDLNLLAKNNFDAFGRLRVSQPFTLFDSQNRYAADPAFDTSLTGSRVKAVIRPLAETRGLPRSITVDHGPEFEGQVLDSWAYEAGVQLSFIRPGKPNENA